MSFKRSFILTICTLPISNAINEIEMMGDSSNIITLYVGDSSCYIQDIEKDIR